MRPDLVENTRPLARAPTVHAARRGRRVLVGLLPWLALGLPAASSMTLAFLSPQPLRTVWALVGLGCGGLLLCWASLRPTPRARPAPSDEGAGP